MTGETIKADPGGRRRQLRSTPIPTCSRAATWCGSAAWATPSTSMRAMGSRIAGLHMLGSGAPIEAEQGVRRGGLGLGQRGHAKARRSGRSSPPISSAASCSRRSRANRSRSCAPAADAAAAPLAAGSAPHLSLDHPDTGMLTQVYIHLGVALAGLVSFLSPCVLPLVPPYLGYLGGTTIEQMTERRPRRRSCLAARGAGLACCSCWASPRCSWRSAPAPRCWASGCRTHKGQLSIVAGARHHRLRPALPRAAARAAALSPGALSHARRGREPRRRLS